MLSELLQVLLIIDSFCVMIAYSIYDVGIEMALILLRNLFKCYALVV